MDRRKFLHVAATVAAASGVVLGREGALADECSKTTTEEITMKKIVMAADPFAVALKDSIKAKLIAEGYEVVDVGATTENELPYFKGAVAACRLLQKDSDARGILLCGTGMGMSIVANRFAGIHASVVESVYAAKMCRAINNANVLCLGAMLWGDWMAKAAVDTFLNTKFTETLEGLADFLHDAYGKVDAIRD